LDIPRALLCGIFCKDLFNLFFLKEIKKNFLGLLKMHTKEEKYRAVYGIYLSSGFKAILKGI
jgi:hypothetical protein